MPSDPNDDLAGLAGAIESTRGEFFPLFGQIASLRQEIQALRAELDGMRINGIGFSGQGPRGIRFDEDQLIGPGSNGGGGATGSFNVCVAGENKMANFVNGLFTGFTDPPE